MKILILMVFVLFCSLFCVYGINNSYAQELTFIQKIERAYDNFLQNEKVVKITTSVKSGWTSFKKWFNNLPGIRDYNNSVYSSKNWKAAMNDMGNEYKPYLQKNSSGTNLLKQGKKKWDNL